MGTFKYDGENLTELTNRADELGPPQGDSFSYLVGFGQDADGEFYVIDWNWFSQNEGQIIKIVPDASHVPAGGETALSAALEITVSQPNPFLERTRFGIATRHGGLLDVSIHDPAGRLVWSNQASAAATGRTWFEWDGRDSRGDPQASGVYFVKARLGENVVSRRLHLVR